MEAVLIDRNLALEIAHNVRHLGGYRTLSGGETGPCFVRAGSLHRLTEGGVEALAAAGICAVVDLRSADERTQMATPALDRFGIRHIAAPVFESDGTPIAFAEDFTGFGPIYAHFLETGRDAYRALFEAAADCDGRLLFHCAAGKDRTGVAAALLLGIADVSDEDIVEDYRVSGGLLEDAFKDWEPTEEQKKRAAQLTDEMKRKLLSSEPEWMLETLAHIRERWGSAEGYLHDIGLDDGTVRELRTRLVA